MDNETGILGDITPMILTFDEIDNIGRTLAKLRWARRILVVDSGSTDGTVDCLGTYPQVEIVSRRFDSFAEQANFGLQQITTNWVLSLDADYCLSDELVEELAGLNASEDVIGYSASFIYCVHGHQLRGSLYPRRTVLYRAAQARYINEGHGHRVKLSGNVQLLKGAIYHDDRKPLRRWLETQQRYAVREADFLINAAIEQLGTTDRLRRMAWPGPIFIIFYVLFIKRCALDGKAGWFYALQRLLAETMIAVQVIDRKLLRINQAVSGEKAANIPALDNDHTRT